MPAVATAIDITGAYNVSVVDTFDNCAFAGQVTFNQSGSRGALTARSCETSGFAILV